MKNWFLYIAVLMILLTGCTSPEIKTSNNERQAEIIIDETGAFLRVEEDSFKLVDEPNFEVAKKAD